MNSEIVYSNHNAEGGWNLARNKRIGLKIYRNWRKVRNSGTERDIEAVSDVLKLNHLDVDLPSLVICSNFVLDVCNII